MSDPPSLAAYRRLLFLLPADFRGRNAADMERVFLEALRARSVVPMGALRAWSSAAWDVVRSAAVMRLGRLFGRRPRARPPHHDLRPKKDKLVFESVISDVWFTLRSLRKSPGFTIVALLTIGLGIGSSTLVFTVVHSVLLKPLPYEQSDRLVNVWNDLIEERQFLPAVHPSDFRDYQEMSTTFEAFAAASGAGQVGYAGVLTGDGPPLHVDLSPVTHNFFSLLGIDPVLGRHFTVEEEAFNGPRVALVSHELWNLRFGGDSTLVGRTIRLDGQAVTVVGILPRGFELLLPKEAFLVKPSDVWVPLQVNFERLPPRNWTWLTVFGRMKPNVTLAQAQSDMDRVADELRATYPEHVRSGMQIRLVSLHDDIVKQARPALLTLLGAVAFVLLIACANVAHLLLLRGTARQRELAMRAALGASRNRIVRQVFTESVVLGILGSGVGLLLAQGGLSLLAALQPPSVPRLGEVGISGPVLAFSITASFVTAVIFGLAPAIHSSRADVGGLLREGPRAGRSLGAARVRNALVAGEIALSLVLLVGAGLMVRSFMALQEVRPGFEPANVLTFRISLPRNQYQGPDAVNFFRELETSIAGLAGVESVGAVSKLPLTGSGVLWPYAYDEETAERFDLSADGRTVTPDYFVTMGTRLVAGRFFTDLDDHENQRVVIVEEMLARRAWPNGDPIGQQLQLAEEGDDRFATVVGVVEHTRVYDLTEDVREHMYVAYAQRAPRSMSVVVRSSMEPEGLASAVSAAVWDIDPNLPVNDLRPMVNYVSDAMAETRFTLLLMSLFGTLALLLAAVGIYGVISYAVRQRAHEFGVRLALGASPRALVRSVVGHGARLVVVAVAVGVGVSLGITRFLRTMLYDVSPTDPLTLGAVAVVLATIALIACYVPARRTASVDPVATLRNE